MKSPRSGALEPDPVLLVERDDELDAFVACIAALRGSAQAGGTCLLLHGEAGAGKTALVKAVRRRTAAEAEWLWGTCEPLIASPAFGPLIDLLDRLPPTLAQAVRSGRAVADVFASMLAMLRDGARPVVLVIDDVHWADSATLDLLRYVGRRIESTRALLVLCWRDDGLPADHPLRLLVGGLPPRRTQRIALKPLTPQAVATLATRAGHRADGLHAATQGNAFYVTEWLAGDGRRLPEALRDAVLGRTASLSAAARRVLELVSVASAGLESEAIESVAGVAAAAVDECTAAGLLRRDGDALRFRHELARQAVESTCDPVRLSALHAAVLDELTRRGAPTARLVHHAERAGLSADVLRLAPVAAREAARAGAHRQAAAHYELALAHGEALDDGRRAELYVAHAEASMATHRLDDALASRRLALGLHRRLGQAVSQGNDLREMARIEWFRGEIAEGKRDATAAIELLSTLSAPRELAFANATMAQLHLLGDVPAVALEWGRRALDWFEMRGDEEGLCYALNTVATAELTVDDRAASWHRLERSLGIALRRDLAEPVSRAYANLASMSLLHRAYERLHRACEAGIGYCDARDLDLYGARLCNRRACGWIEQGEWPAARLELSRVRAMPDLSPLEGEQSLHLMALLDLRSGARGADAYWSRMIDGRSVLSVDPWYAPQAPATAEAAWLRGDSAAVLRVAGGALADALRTRDRWRIGQLACWLRRCGRHDAVDLTDVAPPCSLELKGDLRAAALAWGALGCRYEQGMVLLGGEVDDLREALRHFEELSARPAARIARQRLRAMGIRNLPRGPYRAVRNDPLGLTGRERVVLRLLQQGLSNRAIAERLNRSERTVEHHVSSLLTKLGVASRQDLPPADREI